MDVVALQAIGEQQGDRALAEAARIIAGSIRLSDVACRVGGEEFAVMLPDSDEESGQELAERLGVAPETISRWVNGALIQSRAMDNFLRVCQVA